MRIAFITAGAAGMVCGSCLRDNALARELMARGHEVVLVPTYTPTRSDEPNVSVPRVFLGGINLYLQHKWSIFRHTPWFVDRLLDSPTLLNRAARFALKTQPEQLGSLTVAMLRGDEGPDAKEFLKLASWLAEQVRPDIVDVSNALLLGVAASLRRRLGVPVLCSLSGEDLFLDSLPEPWRGEAIALMHRRAAEVDGFIAFNHYYASLMQQRLEIPAAKLFQVPLGVRVARREEARVESRESSAESGGQHEGSGQGEPRRRTIGYLARICPEKGLHVLCEAFRLLRERPEFADTRLRIAGYLGPRDRPYWNELERQITAWRLRDSVDFVGEVDRPGKIQFLQSLDVFSVPTVYREAKGLPVLEALANGVPVVQPWHGSFTELVNATGGGVLVPPNDPKALADGIAQLLDNAPLREEMGRRGRRAVEKEFSVERMAEATMAVYQRFAR